MAARVFPSGVENMEYEARRQIARAEKEAIGRAAAALIPNNASLFINIGTTTEAVGRALLDHVGLMVITNNINVANMMRVYPTLEVVIAGGVVRTSDGGIVGEAAVDFINQFKVDYAVIGVSAIDDDGALLDFDFREVKVAQAIMANARHVILVSDSTKFERTAPVRIAHISQVDTFITDRCTSDAFRTICAESDVTLIETAESLTRINRHSLSFSRAIDIRFAFASTFAPLWGERGVTSEYDIFVIGGGVNGCGIARDAAGRGYSVFLAEMNDLASGTSSAATKLIHGGLRYLEHYEFRLVREALEEREVLWAMAPHIIWPLRLVLPHHKGLPPGLVPAARPLRLRLSRRPEAAPGHQDARHADRRSGEAAEADLHQGLRVLGLLGQRRAARRAQRPRRRRPRRDDRHPRGRDLGPQGERRLARRGAARFG